MPHIFFNKLEQRKSTQSFFPFYQLPFDQNYNSFGPSTALLYGIGISPNPAGGAPYGFNPSYQYPWSSNWGWSSWGPQISPWQSNWGWSSPSWGYSQYSPWSSPWQSNWGWSSQWASPQSNWGWSNNIWSGGNPIEPVLLYAAPAPSSPWASSSPWTGSDASYPPGTLYGLVKRSNLLRS